jgi:methylaspartate mutase epsilon subunit
MSSNSYSVLLGGLSGDAHSVGLFMLRSLLLENNYNVYFIGNQNTPEDFKKYSKYVNLIMMSSIDGHACEYLDKFKIDVQDNSEHSPIWYIGGNLTIGDDDKAVTNVLLNAGFNRVYPSFVSTSEIISSIHKDLSEKIPVPGHELSRLIIEELDNDTNALSQGKLLNTTLPSQRKYVLSTWRTGSQAKSIQNNAAFLESSPSFPGLLRDIDNGKRPIAIQPRSGTSLIKDQVKLFQSFKETGVDAVSYQVDSLTRNNAYSEAEIAMSKNALNGFPVVNYGVSTLRKVVTDLNLPIQTRHSTRDPRLLAEISYAGGCTGFEGGAICYNIPYYKNYSLRQSIEAWKYVDALTGQYFEQFNIILDREFFGTLTATLLPPCIAIITDVIEMLLAVTQGVKCVSLGYAEQGCRYQDIAAVNVLRKFAKEQLERFGYDDISVHIVFYQYMAAFPESLTLSEQIITESASTAAMAKATRLITKSPVEYRKIPTMEDNIRGIELAKNGILTNLVPDSLKNKIDAEEEIIYREVESIIRSILNVDNCSLEDGIIRGFQKGLIDIPFAPSLYCRGEIKPIRDITGAIRFFDKGNLQIPSDIYDHHKDLVSERKKNICGSHSQSYNEILNADIFKVPFGNFDTWPLDG